MRRFNKLWYHYRNINIWEHECKALVPYCRAEWRYLKPSIKICQQQAQLVFLIFNLRTVSLYEYVYVYMLTSYSSTNGSSVTCSRYIGYCYSDMGYDLINAEPPALSSQANKTGSTCTFRNRLFINSYTGIE
jgi:hypothetical protein